MMADQMVAKMGWKEMKSVGQWGDMTVPRKEKWKATPMAVK
jgi:hypothetical protein